MIAIVAAYVVAHIDEMTPDLLEEVGNVLPALKKQRRRRQTSGFHSSFSQMPRSTQNSAQSARQQPQRRSVSCRSSLQSATMEMRNSLCDSGTAPPTARRLQRSLRSCGLQQMLRNAP